MSSAAAAASTHGERSQQHCEATLQCLGVSDARVGHMRLNTVGAVKRCARACATANRLIADDIIIIIFKKLLTMPAVILKAIT